jgi:hypothetical protein
MTGDWTVRLTQFGLFGSGELWVKIPISDMREIAATKAYSIGRRAGAACTEILSRFAGDRRPDSNHRFLPRRGLRMYDCAKAGAGFAKKTCSNRGFA